MGVFLVIPKSHRGAYDSYYILYFIMMGLNDFLYFKTINMQAIKKFVSFTFYQNWIIKCYSTVLYHNFYLKYLTLIVGHTFCINYLL